MTSRSTSPSEGEIIESGSEKATKSQPTFKGISVDRHSRKRISLSRSPSPVRSPRRDGRNSRSRSPFRERRGSKRPFEDDHYSRDDRYNSKSVKDSFEASRHYHGNSNGRGTYRDPDRGSIKASSLRYDDRTSSRHSREKRQRTLSRSPPRFSDRRSDDARTKQPRGGFRLHAGGNHEDSRGGSSREQSVISDRGSTPVAAAHSKADAEQKKLQTQQTVRFQLGTKAGTDVNGTANSSATDAAAMDVDSVDEATLIEQRRKRREAIKAKHRGPGTPLLVQALSAGNGAPARENEPDTPGQASKAIDALKISPPQTTTEGSGVVSPTAFEITNDLDLANDNNAQSSNDMQQDDEPSAADYDPTVDMQEDKLRDEHRHQGEEVSSSAYNETKNNKQDVLIPATQVEVPAAKRLKDDFDMFAEEEDGDDMFADEPIASKHNAGEVDVAKAVPVPRGKAIDMSMLDDWDDEEGYYKIILGELLDGRYHVQLNLGKGMFSGVVRATDQTTKRLVAIKIIRSNETMKKAALKEIEILGMLNQADPEDKKHMIRLERYFEHKGHLCMVFENLSINLREVLKKFGRDVGINLKAVRAYAQQMFLGLGLLRKCNVLHADIKPDNVLVNESRNMLKICDLGSASDASENEITPYLVSRFYRAPEIILGMPYDFAIDTWSIGCTLFELYTGKILFTGRTNNQMLRAIMECRGKFSHKILRKAQFASLHFDDLLNFRSVEIDKISGKDVVRMLNFTKPTRDLRSRLTANAKGMADVEARDLNHFIDLLERCLNLNPEKRCTPAEALRHPFIMRTKA